MRVLQYLVIAILVALPITWATFLVDEPVVASIPGGGGAAGSADTHGFPIPYAYSFYPGMSAGGPGTVYVDLNNAYFYHPLNLAEDFAIWLAISLAAVSMFTFRRLLVAAGAGVGVTLATLELSPLTVVAPQPALMASLTPMGFPYEYLTYYQTGFLDAVSSGYDFNLGAALADLALWIGVAMAVVGVVTVTIKLARKAFRPLPHPLG